MKAIVGHSASFQKNWEKRLNDAVRSFNMGVSNHFALFVQMPLFHRTLFKNNSKD